MYRIFKILICTHFFAQQVLAQVDSLAISAPYKLTVEEDILNLKLQNVEEREISAASRTLEKVFETVTATSIVTAEEIKQSGATNLPEALRLLPELLIRQKTNGYFSVHIRGDIPMLSGDQLSHLDNSLVLLSINHVPMNDLFQGGIFWEAVPVELSDIKRIEVVRTPHTVMYGPSAVSGVINIVTKQVESNLLKAAANFQAGSSGTFFHRGNASFAATEGLKFRISTYYNSRDRFQDPYYVFNQGRYIPSDSLLFYDAGVEKSNAYTAHALQSFGVNGYAFWQLKPKIDIEASVSTQNSNVQSVLQKMDQLSLTNRTSKTNLVNIQSRIYNFNTNLAYQSGIQNMALGYEGFEVETEKLFSSADYSYLAKNYQLKVGANLQRSVYRNLSSYVSLIDNSSKKPLPYGDRIILGKSFVSEYGLYLTQNFYFIKRNLRISASVRGDFISPAQHYYLSYQVGSSYKIGTKSILRVVHSTGLQHGAVQDYFSLSDTTFLQYEVNDLLRPIRIETYEAGFRIKPLKEFYANITLFSNRIQNFLPTRELTDLAGKADSEQLAWQNGVTLSGNLTLNKFRCRAFLTTQETRIQSRKNWEKDIGTPGYYGGVSCNYSLFLNKLTVNTNLYYYDGYTFTDQLNNYHMSGKTIANVKLSYNVWGEHNIYFNGKNMLNDKSVEFPFADKIKRLYLIGVELVF